MRIKYFFPGLLLLSNCSTLGRIDPPNPPSPSDIGSSYKDVETGAKSTDSSVDYVKAGYRKVDIDCDTFFRALAQAGRNFDFAKRETILGIATTSSFLALLHNSAQTLALVASGGALVADTIDNAEDYALLTRYTAQLKGIVDKDRAIYKASNPPESVGEDKFKADDFVRGYANRCTVDTIEADISQALSLSTPELSSSKITPVSAVAVLIQRDLGLSSTPTADDVARLSKLLNDPNPANRVSFGGTDSLAAANGRYWDAAGAITKPLGSDMKDLLNTVSSATSKPAPAGTSPTVNPVVPALEESDNPDAKKILDTLTKSTGSTGQGSATNIEITPKAANK